MAGGAHPFRLLIVAAEPGQAQAVLKRLHASLPRVRGLFTQHPSKLRTLLSEHPCDLILVRLGGVIAAAEVATVCRETDLQTPMVILAQDGQNPAELVELIAAGACGLIRDLDDDRLPGLVRRLVEHADTAARLSARQEQASQCGDSSQGLIDPCPSPVALAHQSIDAETGLPDRRALLEVLSQRLEDDASQDRCVTLVYVRMEDFDAVCRGYGLTRGLEHAATTASHIRAAIAEDAFAARVADDACVILMEDTGDLTPEGMSGRLMTRLAEVAPNEAAPSLTLGIASGRPGDIAASSLLDQAFADCLMASPAEPRTRANAEQLPELPIAPNALMPRDAGPANAHRRAFEPNSRPLTEPDSTSGLPPGGQVATASGPAVELTLGPEFIPEVGLKREPKPGSLFGPEFGSGQGPKPDLRSDPVGGPIGHPGADADSEYLSLHQEFAPYSARLDDGILDDSLSASIERALETDGFTIMYQPIISLMGDSQEHYSVLLRLRGEHDRLVTARELLGPAARAGSLPDVDRWVMQRAFQEQARRRRVGQKVSLFLSLSKEIVQDERLLISICDSLREFEIHGSWITFQFQQSEALALGDKWTLLADGLKKIQCRICVNQVGLMDDTEHGMETMQADFIKFAPELAIGFAADQVIQKRLLQLINIAQERGVKTIVTGVEDTRSLALLWSTGIDYVQGNFLHRALPNLDAPT
jgi:EAL domain-containing protein (putative c-di-GMP-specific phosphodiesterase class I)/GGDEF domain-containing protein